ncbi:tetratricopeptide repeat protein [Rubripirellula reticaptiva]|uniref:Tetratricopeptide repeat protein n=1 Tax=Rubripirellula reticaptiva TaxID=2528013 RepID=A0A5C6EQX3_9BACT|nr:hypothetical protein [Rubripirellula reticaptiva]TWU51338.1 hypothetical protein Poly59_29300 [Rubripirellula reticaptiva]
MSHDPFSEHASDSRTAQTSANQPSGSNKTIGLILGGLTLLGILFCGGVAVIAYFAVQGAAGSTGLVAVPPRPTKLSEAFQVDANNFERSLVRRFGESQQSEIDSDSVPHFDSSVAAFVNECVEANRVGDTIPMNREMFLDAVQASPCGNSEFGLIDRMAIRSWLDQYEPAPDKFDTHVQIIDVHVDSGTLPGDPKLAQVSLIFYSEESQADAQQWFLINAGDKWEIYDWQSLDFGRRTSDEYAAYNAGDPATSDGYDSAIDQAVDAQRLWNEGQQELAIAKLRQCEAIPMLAEDRSIAMLRIAYIWMSFDEYGEAIRPLTAIKNPDQMWGVWPVLSVCYLNTGEKERALKAALKSQAQSANHPRTHWLLATVYEAFDRDDESADEAVIALQGCPLDQTLVNMVTNNRRTEDVPALVSAVAQIGMPAWIQLADSAAYGMEWSKAVLDFVESGNGIETDAAIVALLRANEAWSRQDYDAAAENFILARDKTSDDQLRRVAVQDHADARIERDRYLSLFTESDDVEGTIRTLCHWVFQDEFYGDVQSLLTAFETHEMDEILSANPNAQPWEIGVRGWCRHELDEHDLALPDLTEFVDWLSSEAITANESTNGDSDPQWLIDSSNETLTETMLSLGKYRDVVERFPNHAGYQSMLVNDLMVQGKESVVAFLDATQTATDPVIKLTRTRLEAFLSVCKGDVSTADSLHRKAISIVDQADPENEHSLRLILNRQRAIDSVINRALPSEIEMAEIDLPLVIFHAVEEAARLNDSKTMRAWAQRVEAVDSDNVDHVMIKTRFAELRFAGGQYGETVELLSESQLNGSEGYWSNRQRELRKQALLELGKSDVLLSELFSKPLSDDGLAPPKPSLHGDGALAVQALALVAKGDFEKLDSIFSTVDKDEVGNWLSIPSQRRWLVRHADDPSIKALLQKHPMSIGYLAPESLGQIWTTANRSMTKDDIESLLESEMGEIFEVVPVSLANEAKESSAWTASSASGQRILIGSSIQTARGTRLPIRKRDEFSQPLLRISIAILDQLPNANRRLFEIASALASDDAIAFTWVDESLTWFGPDLPSKIRWEDRVPIHAETTPTSIDTAENDEDMNSDPRSPQEWTSDLKSSQTPLLVQVTLECGEIIESLPATLIRVEADQYGLIVESMSDSKIEPLFKTGQTYSIRPGYISRAEP